MKKKTPIKKKTVQSAKTVQKKESKSKSASGPKKAGKVARKVTNQIKRPSKKGLLPGGKAKISAAAMRAAEIAMERKRKGTIGGTSAPVTGTQFFDSTAITAPKNVQVSPGQVMPQALSPVIGGHIWLGQPMALGLRDISVDGDTISSADMAVACAGMGICQYAATPMARVDAAGNTIYDPSGNPMLAGVPVTIQYFYPGVIPGLGNLALRFSFASLDPTTQSHFQLIDSDGSPEYFWGYYPFAQPTDPPQDPTSAAILNYVSNDINYKINNNNFDVLGITGKYIINAQNPYERCSDVVTLWLTVVDILPV